MDTFGKRLRHFREFLGYSREEFSALVNISRNAIGNTELDKVTMEQYTRNRIYEAFPKLNKIWLEKGVGEMGEVGLYKNGSEGTFTNDVKGKNDVNEPITNYKKPDNITINPTDLFISYYKEINLITELLVNKQDGYRSIIEALKSNTST